MTEKIPKIAFSPIEAKYFAFFFFYTFCFKQTLFLTSNFTLLCLNLSNLVATTKLEHNLVQFLGNPASLIFDPSEFSLNPVVRGGCRTNVVYTQYELSK